MNSIYLLRHCDYNNPLHILPGRLPVELSPEGKANASRLKKYFAAQNIKQIYSSAVLRCKQTSEIIADHTIPVTFDQRLLETISAYQGYWEGNADNAWSHFFVHRDELGGENFADIKTRVASFWDEITVDLHDNIIICSHGDQLQILFSYINGQPLVTEDASEENIPGWLGRGEFFEIIWDNKRILKIEKSK
jgi:broad specificity phosphatase PhoE